MSNLKPRDLYLNKISAFQDTEVVKVLTGIRRSGKSSLLKLMIGRLRSQGIPEEQILEMNFESYKFRNMTCDDFYHYVESHVVPGKKTYLFFDEVQYVTGWEDAVNAFRVDFDCDIYLTGSNAYMLSSEYSTYLSGRCVEIHVLPLSFREFLLFHEYEIRESEPSFGTVNRQIYDKSGNLQDPKELLRLYLRFGGMPGITETGLDQERVLAILDEIYTTVVGRDILLHGSFRGKRITDDVLLRKIVRFLADNIGSNVSPSSIGNTLMNEGLLEGRKRSGKPNGHTMQSYINALLESYFFYEIKRFDIKGKEYLRTLGKYYIADIGLRNYLLGFRDRDIDHILENIVFFELRKRGYDIAIGKSGSEEIDFIATKPDEKLYIQVAESMMSETVRQRELKPLMAVMDNYPKIVLSMETGLESVFEGIQSISLIDWLLEE